MKNFLTIVAAFSMLLSCSWAYRDLETGTFITRDPLGFVDGPNLYTYVVQNPWSKFDPTGLKETTITDAQAAKLKDSAPMINGIVNSVVKGVLADVKSGKISAKQAKEEVFKRLTQPYGLGGNDTKLAKDLASQGNEYYQPGTSFGTKHEGGIPIGGGNAGFESIVKLTYKDSEAIAGGVNWNGEAVGTDKIDHIFFDGYQISGLDAKSARQTSEENEKGITGLKNTGVYSQADIEANMVGYEFYNNVQNAAEKGEDYTFDPKKVDTTKLNENKTKNTYTPAVKKQVEENEKKQKQ